MNPTSEILARMENSSRNHPEGIFTRLYRYLLREDIYMEAYKSLYANNGASTKGTDNDTADGFSIDYVQSIIRELTDLSYQPKPVRRVYIPKRNGKVRPLGIPSFRDKLVQDANKANSSIHIRTNFQLQLARFSSEPELSYGFEAGEPSF